MKSKIQISDCIFCKIASGKAEASKIYEDDKILAFMNIRPVNKGEFLVIPKIHVDHFTDLPDPLVSHIVITAQQLSRRLMEKFKPKRVGYIVHGFGVAHAHFNVVPLSDPNDVVSMKQLRVLNNQIINDLELLPASTRNELDEIASLLRG